MRTSFLPKYQRNYCKDFCPIIKDSHTFDFIDWARNLFSIDFLNWGLSFRARVIFDFFNLGPVKQHIERFRISSGFTDFVNVDHHFNPVLAIKVQCNLDFVKNQDISTHSFGGQGSTHFQVWICFLHTMFSQCAMEFFFVICFGHGKTKISSYL